MGTYNINSACPMYHYPLAVCGKFNRGRKIGFLYDSSMRCCDDDDLSDHAKYIWSGRPVSSNWSYLPVRLYGWYECDVFMGDAGLL